MNKTIIKGIFLFSTTFWIISAIMSMIDNPNKEIEFLLRTFLALCSYSVYIIIDILYALYEKNNKN